MEEIYPARPVQVPAAGLWTSEGQEVADLVEAFNATVKRGDALVWLSPDPVRCPRCGQRSASNGTGASRGGLLPTATIVPVRPQP